MDNHKICFIICYNDETDLNECILYLQKLTVPTGFVTDLITIEGADSMTAGYNAAMHASDAKYKVYMHQDVFILNQGFLEETLMLFKSDERIGMIGMVGTLHLPMSGVMWDSNERIGALRSCHLNTVDDYFDKDCFREHAIVNDMSDTTDYAVVEAVDGLLMMTQYDVEWREDLFTGWDFYDVSQSFAFRNAGYQVIVPRQESPWVLHDCGFLRFEHYEKYRKIFCQEYLSERKDNTESNTDGEDAAKEKEQLMDKQKADEVIKKIEQMIAMYIDTGKIDFAKETIEQYIRKLQNSEMVVKLYILFRIRDEELEANVADLFSTLGEISTRTLLSHYRKLIFYIRRFAYDVSEEGRREAIQYFTEKKVSRICLEDMCQFAGVNAEKLLETIRRYYPLFEI